MNSTTNQARKIAFPAIALVAAVSAAGAQAVTYSFDSTPPEIKIKAKPTQRLDGETAGRFRVSCDERCRAALTGDAIVKAKPKAGVKADELRLKRDFARKITPGDAEPMRLQTTSEKAAAKLRRALEAGAKVRVEARVRGEDEIGNPAKAYRTIKLKP